jgi:hypothetical protein
MKPAKKSNALIDLSDEELESALRKEAEHVIYSYNGMVEEMQRRSQDRHTQAIERLTKWAVILTAVASVSALVSAFAAIASLFKG